MYSISLFYGSNSSHFYISQAIPFTTLFMLPFVVHGLLLTKRGAAADRLQVAKWIIGITIGLYSLLGHKEFRFIHPILPLLHIFAAKSLVDLSDLTASTSKTTHISRLGIKRRYLLLLSLNAIPLVYLNFYHSVAQISVLSKLREIPRSELKSVAFLMPCHSTPWQAYLHRNDLEVPGELFGTGVISRFTSGEGGKAWFLTCEPPVLYVLLNAHKSLLLNH